jgi:DNA (cytosine-5)-methyltransferase 1
MLNGLSLFTGIGGLDVALSEWVKPIAYCEIDPYCQGVLLSIICNGRLFQAPIWDDIRSLRSTDFNGFDIDIIYGGFPCQGISVAGLGKGLEDERSGLFFEIVRLAKEIKPKFIFLENVPAITTRGGLDVVKEIAEMGYDCRWCVISAASIGALHKRERWFLLARYRREQDEKMDSHSSCGKYSSKQTCERTTYSRSKDNGFCQDVADPGCKCQRSEKKPEWPSLHFTGCGRIWEVEPEVGCLVDGLPMRMDQLRALGNSVVPCQAKEAFKILMGLN